MYSTKPARLRLAHNLMRRIWWAALVLSLAGSGCATENVDQSAAGPEPTLQPTLELCPVTVAPNRELASKPGYVQLTVYVTDAADKPVASLKQSDFAAIAGDKRLPIEFFHDNQGGLPLSLEVALDTSGSMLDKLGIEDPINVQNLWGGLAALMAQLNECDEVAALQFGGLRPADSGYDGSHDNASDTGGAELTLVEPLTTDHELALTRLTYVVPFGKTPLYDAIHQSLQTLAAAHYPDRALIVITDGLDTASTRSEQDVLDEATASRVVIYPIGIGNPNAPAFGANLVGLSGGNEDVDIETLDDFSSATTGRAFIGASLWTDGGASFTAAMARVGVILGHSYSIGVVMPPGGGESPAISVPSHPEALVQAHRVIPIPAAKSSAAVASSASSPG